MNTDDIDVNNRGYMETDTTETSGKSEKSF